MNSKIRQLTLLDFLYNNHMTIQELQYFKTITEYQIAWLSANYDMPNLNWGVLTSKYKEVNKDKALRIIDYWLKYESSIGISVLNKSIFDTDSNATVILKLKSLVNQLNSNISKLSEGNLKSAKNSKADHSLARLEKSIDGTCNVVLSIGKRGWFRNGDIVISLDDAKKLAFEINDILNSLK